MTKYWLTSCNGLPPNPREQNYSLAVVSLMGNWDKIRLYGELDLWDPWEVPLHYVYIGVLAEWLG